MTLQQLFSEYIPYLIPRDQMQSQFLDQEVDGLFFDHRNINNSNDTKIKNSVFFAISGINTNGHEYINQAVESGSIALVLENDEAVPINYQGAVFKVTNSRIALDEIASKFYSSPSEKLFCIGVTGTNGKTSITYILEHILNNNQKLTGVLGTVNHRIGENIWNSQMTTPDPVTLQSRLQDFVRHRAFAAAMEISSHALDQQRANSVQFNTVIYTNLTLDHLDYHKTMDHYFESKQKLFTDLLWASKKKPLFAIVNTDDKYGRRLKVAAPAIVWTYGQGESDFQIDIKKMDFNETVFILKNPFEDKEFKIFIPGIHTVYNVVACIIAAITCGVTMEQSAEALLSFKGIPGRLEKIETSSDKIVFVDYAHTPDALENTIKSIRKIQKDNNLDSKLLCIFGCGGDRDKSKRPQMAKIASENCDYVMVTSDNPRTEDPYQIINDILSGVPTYLKNTENEIDREKAIQKMIQKAQPKDIILIAGKGHEDYQIIGTEKKYFSDAKIVKKYLG